MATSAVLIPTQALSTPLTMTSIEIAEVTGKRHDHVVRDLRKLHEQGVIDLPRFGETIEIKDVDGRVTGTRTIYKLPKRETLLLTSGYSAVQRAAVIDRLFLLEAHVGAPVAPAPAAPTYQLALTAEQYIAYLEQQLGVSARVIVPPATVAATTSGAPRPVTAAETAEALRLLNAGTSLSEIARHLGRSRRTIGRILERTTAAAEGSV
jgi:DNA-binding transcriptional ArsR family regulator